MTNTSVKQKERRENIKFFLSQSHAELKGKNFLFCEEYSNMHEIDDFNTCVGKIFKFVKHATKPDHGFFFLDNSLLELPYAVMRYMSIQDVASYRIKKIHKEDE